MLPRMTREMIVQIWESEGMKPSGHTLVIRDDREASCFIQTAGEVMSISRVTKIELRDGFLSMQTVKDERFVFAYEDVLGWKINPAVAPKDRPTGFAR